MNLEPNTSFLVDYKINNPSDPATYFVQAKIFSSVSGQLIVVLNLTDNGSKYYSALWTTPVDNSGVGLQIKIFVTVYEDANHTIESATYGTTLQNFIVRHLASQNLGGFSRGGSDVDYRKIEKMIADALEKMPKQNQKTGKAYDDTELRGTIASIADLVKDLDQGHGENLVNVQNWIADRLREHSETLANQFNENMTKGITAVIRALEGHDKLSDGRSEGISGALKNADVTKAIKDLSDGMNEVHETIRGSHKEIIKGLKSPLTVKLEQETPATREGVKDGMPPSRDDVERQAKQGKVDERRQTVESLLSLSKSQEE